MCTEVVLIKDVTWHSTDGYDGHLLVEVSQKGHGRTWVIATNFEKYMSIQVGKVLLLDSFQFTLSSLDPLANTMENEDFVVMKKEYSGRDVMHHCHNYDENETECGICQENRKIEICRQFGTELSTGNCHNYFETEEECELCTVNRTVVV